MSLDADPVEATIAYPPYLPEQYCEAFEIRFDLNESSGETVMRKWTSVESFCGTECLDISMI